MPGDFDESKHRRAEDGKFTDGPGGEGGAKVERTPKAKELAKRVKEKRGSAKKAAEPDPPADGDRDTRRESIRAVREKMVADEATTTREFLERQRRSARYASGEEPLPNQWYRVLPDDRRLLREGRDKLTDEQIEAEAQKAASNLAEKFDLIESEWDKLEPVGTATKAALTSALDDLDRTAASVVRDVETRHATARDALSAYADASGSYQSALGDEAEEDDEESFASALDEQMYSVRSEFGVESPPADEAEEVQDDEPRDYGPPDEPTAPERGDYDSDEEYNEAVQEHEEYAKEYPAALKAYEKRVASLEKGRRAAAATAAQALDALAAEQEAAIKRLRDAAKKVSRAERRAEKEAPEPDDLIRKGVYDPEALDEDSDSFDPEVRGAYERTLDAADAMIEIEGRRGDLSYRSTDRSAEISALRDAMRTTKRAAKALARAAKGAKPAPVEEPDEPDPVEDDEDEDDDEDEE